jgi:ribonuclease P protein component
VNRRNFPPARRLRRPQDFERVYAQNQRAGDACLLLLAAANSTGRTRLGLSVSRKHGNSVARHRLKRLLREAYRLEQDNVPEGLDLVLIPKQNAQAGIDQYRAAIVRLSRKLARRLLPGESQPPPAPCIEPPP